MTGTIQVTPTLCVGDLPPARPNAYRATTTGEALQLIDAGLVAVLPADSGDLLEDVLRVLVDDHAHVLRLLHQARTGEWRKFRCDCPSCLAGLTRPRRAPDGSLIWYDEQATGPSATTNDPSTGLSFGRADGTY